MKHFFRDDCCRYWHDSSGDSFYHQLEFLPLATIGTWSENVLPSSNTASKRWARADTLVWTRRHYHHVETWKLLICLRQLLRLRSSASGRKCCRRKTKMTLTIRYCNPCVRIQTGDSANVPPRVVCFLQEKYWLRH